jgi:hypothetical protein
MNGEVEQGIERFWRCIGMEAKAHPGL